MITRPCRIESSREVSPPSNTRVGMGYGISNRSGPYWVLYGEVVRGEHKQSRRCFVAVRLCGSVSAFRFIDHSTFTYDILVRCYDFRCMLCDVPSCCCYISCYEYEYTYIRYQYVRVFVPPDSVAATSVRVQQPGIGGRTDIQQQLGMPSREAQA